jgi:hypothetical protein
LSATIFVLILLGLVLFFVGHVAYDLIVNEGYNDLRGIELPQKREDRFALFVVAIGGVLGVLLIIALVYTSFASSILSLLSALWKCSVQHSC